MADELNGDPLESFNEPLDDATFIEKCKELESAVSPHFEGQRHDIVGGVLAFCTAQWIECVKVEDDDKETENVRRQLLLQHVKQVKKALGLK